MIQTVLGPVDGSELGYTLMHEHITMMDHVMRFTFPDWLDEKRLIDLAVPQLKRLYELGIRTIIDATPINLGRDVNLIAELSKLSGIHMVACTGLYHFESPWVEEVDPDWLADLFVRELCEGIQGTSMRAGAVKCCTDEQGVTPINRAMLLGSAKAAIRTGVPILTHTCTKKKNGLEQQQVLLDAGVDPKRLVIGHSGDSNDLEYLEALLKNGSYLGMDRFGLEQFNPMEDRISTIVKLVERGWAGRLMLSHDSNFYEDAWRPWHKPAYHPQGAHNMRIVSEIVIPALLQRGVSQQDIDRMMCGNVQALFEA